VKTGAEVKSTLSKPIYIIIKEKYRTRIRRKRTLEKKNNRGVYGGEEGRNVLLSLILPQIHPKSPR
jgi:hypothetical protein